MDFTQKRYKNLLETLLQKGYTILPFYDYLQFETPNSKPETLNPKQQVILRHDVDLKPENSLATAKIEHELGISGSYYFRAVPESWNEEIIKQIAELGHEVGYHYENLTICKGDIEKAFEDFKQNLDQLRKIVPVSTICMHGSPKSRYDNREIWKKYSYHELGIVGEPYFDIDFNQVFYLTDTGRRWDGFRVSVRDKISQQETWNQQGLRFKSTKQIIKAAIEDRLPSRIMITVHPQRWTNSFIPWAKELIWQNMKNTFKRIIIRAKY